MKSPENARVSKAVTSETPRVHAHSDRPCVDEKGHPEDQREDAGDAEDPVRQRLQVRSSSSRSASDRVSNTASQTSNRTNE